MVGNGVSTATRDVDAPECSRSLIATLYEGTSDTVAALGASSEGGAAMGGRTERRLVDGPYEREREGGLLWF